MGGACLDQALLGSAAAFQTVINMPHSLLIPKSAYSNKPCHLCGGIVAYTTGAIWNAPDD